MKIRDMVSDSFGVVNGLRQGRVLYPVLFSFIVYKLTSEQAHNSRG